MVISIINSEKWKHDDQMQNYTALKMRLSFEAMELIFV